MVARMVFSTTLMRAAKLSMPRAPIQLVDGHGQSSELKLQAVHVGLARCTCASGCGSSLHEAGFHERDLLAGLCVLGVHFPGEVQDLGVHALERGHDGRAFSWPFAHETIEVGRHGLLARLVDIDDLFHLVDVLVEDLERLLDLDLDHIRCHGLHEVHHVLAFDGVDDAVELGVHPYGMLRADAPKLRVLLHHPQVDDRLLLELLVRGLDHDALRLAGIVQLLDGDLKHGNMLAVDDLLLNHDVQVRDVGRRRIHR